MNEQVHLAGDAFADLVEEFLVHADVPHADEWVALLGDIRTTTLTGNPAARDYWIDIYRRRQETAERINTGQTDELARVVRDLARSEDDFLVLFLITTTDYGYFVWLSRDLSSVASYFRGTDKRSSQQS